MAKAEIDLLNLTATTLRVVAAAGAGAAPGAESSMLKVKGTEIRQEILSLARRGVERYALPYQREVLEPGSHATPIGPE